jgi:hypothetical protein
MATVSIQFRKGAEHDGKPSAIEHDGAEVVWIPEHDAFGPHLQVTGDGYRVCIALTLDEMLTVSCKTTATVAKASDWWQ